MNIDMELTKRFHERGWSVIGYIRALHITLACLGGIWIITMILCVALWLM